MNLSDYLKKHELTQSAFAERVGVTQGMVAHWVTGKHRVSAESAVKIEAATDGAVGKHELRDDLFDPPRTTRRAA